MMTDREIWTEVFTKTIVAIIAAQPCHLDWDGETVGTFVYAQKVADEALLCAPKDKIND